MPVRNTWKMLLNGLRQIMPSGCWHTFHKPKPTGYVQIHVEGDLVFLHRYSYEKHNGPVPEGLVVRHRCDNRRCWNPAHLEVGTHADNTQDMLDRGRCQPARGVYNGQAKLSNDQVREIYSSSASVRELAKLFGVHEVQVRRIRSGQAWAHITQKGNKWRASA